MLLPNLSAIQKLLASGEPIRARVLRIARRLEDLNEYSPEQALRVAADIVLQSLNRPARPLT